MITNLALGSNGRLGNQMFQYAMLLGIKNKLGFEVIIDEEVSQKSIYGHFELTNCFQLKECHFYNISGIYTPTTYEEERFIFDSRLFKKITDNTNFHGKFQSEKFFTHCEDFVRKEFTFRSHIVEESKNFLEPFKNKRLISLHVRRGDYLNSQNFHPLCSLEYYKKAITHFGDDVQYVVMSDDIQWCRENLQIENAIYSKNSTPSIDMCIMSLCNDHIIANSTFSWWGAWLNSNLDKKVIAPKVWFGPLYSHYDTSDLYCKNWIKI